VTSALEGVSGVIKATASFETKSAKVKGKGRICKVDRQDPLIEALTKAGYDGKVTSID